MKFRKKPIVIEATQWFPGIPIDGVKESERFYYFREGPGQYVGPCGEIKTLEGIMIAIPGDWIIRGVKGEIYPCKPDIFEATYERVEDGGREGGA